MIKVNLKLPRIIKKDSFSGIQNLISNTIIFVIKLRLSSREWSNVHDILRKEYY